MNPSGSAPVREGDMLAGKYRVERVLGAGGMGIVVAARHVQLDQLVAIKFIRDEALANDDAVHRFLREARAAVKLKSEHVARVLDVGTLESGAPYMVMELLDGRDLGQVLDEHGALAVDEVTDWVLQACEAIAEAHAAGIVHRDLKPENLFLARTVGGISQIKVLDFGVSKSVHAISGGMAGLTRTRAMLGSPLYMSPEQMRSSREVDARADVWALGVVLFELLTTKWPFEAETMPDLCLKVVSEPPQSLAALRPDVPKAMCDVVARCLEKDPAKRFANAAELASAIEPLAPPASRILAERARLAMSSGGGERMPLRAPAPTAAVAIAATLQSVGTPLPAGTPSSWSEGSKTDVSPPPVPSPRRGRWIVGAAILGALSVGMLLALRTPEARHRPAIPPAQATQLAAQPVITLPSAATSASSPTAVTLAPTSAPQVVAPALSQAPAPVPSQTPAHAHTPAPVANQAPGHVAPNATNAPKPGPKPGKDDDIPSLR